jgi:hypothetical protein
MDGFLSHSQISAPIWTCPSASEQTLKNVLKETIVDGNNEPSYFLSTFPFSLSFSAAGIGQSV